MITTTQITTKLNTMTICKNMCNMKVKKFLSGKFPFVNYVKMGLIGLVLLQMGQKARLKKYKTYLTKQLGHTV